MVLLPEYSIIRAELSIHFYIHFIKRISNYIPLQYVISTNYAFVICNNEMKMYNYANSYALGWEENWRASFFGRIESSKFLYLNV